MKLNVATSSEEYASAEEMIIDEGGIDLFIDGVVELGGSFENLDNFELAYRVLPEHFELEYTERFFPDLECGFAEKANEDELEALIWIYTQELAKRQGWSK